MLFEAADRKYSYLCVAGAFVLSGLSWKQEFHNSALPIWLAFPFAIML
jgi:hypothetical protein